MRIGTASVRRRAQLLALEPTLSIEPLRGNIDTRLRKRGERGLDAVVLAACGLDRLGLEREIGLRFDPVDLLPEAGQGALALQVRAGEEELVAAADDAETRRRVEAERRCVALVGGGCLAPVAAHHDGSSLTALVADEDGAWIERRTGSDPDEVARELLVVRFVRVDRHAAGAGRSRSSSAASWRCGTRSSTARCSRSSRSGTVPWTCPATTGWSSRA